jgi:uncharacterized protein YukE
MFVDYNNASTIISMRPERVYLQARSMDDELDTLHDAWENIMQSWDRLKLSWTGKTQQEVDDFQKAIDKLHTEIFGTSKPDPKHPHQRVVDQPGLYQLVSEIAAGAAENVNSTDYSVQKMFLQLSSDITRESYLAEYNRHGEPVFVTPDPRPKGNVPDQTDPYISETFH